MKVVLCGPPQSGKLYLQEGLNQAIRRISDPALPPMIISNSHVEEIPPLETRGWQFKSAKRSLTDEAESPKTWDTRGQQGHLPTHFPGIEITIGRPMAAMNGWKVQGATHAIVLSAEKQRLLDWAEWCLNLNLRLVAVLESDYYGFCDRITAETPFLQGSIHRLGPGQDLSMRPVVQILASILLHLSQVSPLATAKDAVHLLPQREQNQRKTV